MADIEALEGAYETLQTQHQQLQNTYSAALTQQQIAQQQAWAKRLAVALATHLQGRLEAALVQANSVGLPGAHAQQAIAPLNAASQSLAALDTTLQTTLASLQQDLTSYHSGISQQISRMQNVEQQGEAILEALVARLSQHLQSQMVPPQVTRNGHGALPPLANGASYNPNTASPAGRRDPLPGPALPLSPYRGPQPSLPQTELGVTGFYAGSAGVPVSDATSSVPLPRPQSETLDRATAPHGVSNRPLMAQSQVGLLLVVLSTLALSLHNVVVGVIGYGGQLLGRLPVEAVLPLTIPNSLLLLWLRMVVFVPLLALVAPRLYPRVGSDLRQLFQSADRRPLGQAVASGGFLFLSQVLIYQAIADVGPGVAVTLLFMYPLITVPLTWFLFGDRPTSLRLVVMFAISMGIVFTALPSLYTDISGNGGSLWGIGAALLAGIAFAFFLMAMQLSIRRLHPVPMSLLQFGTIFILTSLMLILGSFFRLTPGEATQPLGLYLGAGVLGLLTLLGYVLNDYGVKRLGASQSSIVEASGPVVTAILATMIIPGEKSSLLFIQWMGVVLVTLGVISLSLERLANHRRQPRRRSSAPAHPDPQP
jgi:drug/metabolite transporter (DMT)-like permease